MVRTYKVSALTQSDGPFNHTMRVKEQKVRNIQTRNASSRPRQEPVSAPADPAPTSSIQSPCTQCHSYEMLHSPYADPVGSIVGLRVVYMDGKITYVPVEPQINYLINKQFGPYGAQPSPYCSHPFTPPTAAYTPWDYNLMAPRQAPYPTPLPMQTSGYGSVQSQSPPADPGPQHNAGYPPRAPVNQYVGGPASQFAGTNVQNMPNTYDKVMRYPPHHVETPQAQTNQMQRTNNVRANENLKEKSMEGGFFFGGYSNAQPKSGVRRSREWMNDDVKEYNPWGKGGGGSPLKDEFGNLVADRRQLGRSWKTQLSTNQPHHLHVDRFGQSYRSSFLPDLSNNHWHYSAAQTPAYSGGVGYLSQASSGSMPNLNNRALSDSERHKLELQQQIDENKRRKEYEKQKERDDEEREMRKHDQYMERIRQNEEEEKRREREKGILADRRRQQVYEEQQKMAKQMKRVRTPPPREAPRERVSTPNSVVEDDGKSWWEKKPTYGKPVDEDRKSAVIPTLRGKPPRPASRGPSANSRSISRHSRGTYDPSTSLSDHVEQEERMERENTAKSQQTASRRSRHTSSEELSDSFRRMSATQTILTDERERVQTALSNNDYGEHVFSDANGRPTAFVIR